MTIEQRRNVFVTQLHEREGEDDENTKSFPVVKDNGSRLLETGINTLQKTLLLKKEVEVEKVQCQLVEKREEFRRRMEQCADRQVVLQKEQQKMKDRISKFEKFIAENEGKRRRAIQKYQQEVKLKEQKSRELESLKIEMEELKSRHQKLQKKIEVFRLYEKFLLQTIERLPENYLEMSESLIHSLMMRYDTLSATNQSLINDLDENSTELERLKSLYEQLKMEHDKQIVSESSRLAGLQKMQERLIDGRKESEEHFMQGKEASREEMAELGLILMAVGNIASKCQHRHKARSDEKPINSMTLDEKLEAIKQYLIDLKDVHHMTLEMTKTSRDAGASAMKHRGRVHFDQ